MTKTYNQLLSEVTSRVDNVAYSNPDLRSRDLNNDQVRALATLYIHANLPDAVSEVCASIDENVFAALASPEFKERLIEHYTNDACEAFDQFQAKKYEAILQ